ncbi:hypothetical protein CXF74_21710 [Psychromonas sp. Urea-02u-13]|nr:hypothetical protein CXF74_21710 [Psychromonas sp. Urea-02u-13]
MDFKYSNQKLVDELKFKLIQKPKHYDFQIDEFEISPIKVTAQSTLFLSFSILDNLYKQHGKTLAKTYTKN